MEVIIKQHKKLFDLLRHPNELWKVLLSLFLTLTKYTRNIPIRYPCLSIT